MISTIGMNTIGTNISAGGGFGSYMLVNAAAAEPSWGIIVEENKMWLLQKANNFKKS